MMRAIQNSPGQTDTLTPLLRLWTGVMQNGLRSRKNQAVSLQRNRGEWLTMIKDHIPKSVTTSVAYFCETPFFGKGGMVRAYEVFGRAVDRVINELDAELTAYITW